MATFAPSVALAPTRSAEACTDSELVAEVRRGDPRAFEELYTRYHRRIAAYVNGMVGDHGRAEELTQDVFLSALRRMRDTERSIAFKPWIYEIAKNACIDQFRRSRRAELVSIDADEGLGAADYGRLVSRTAAPDAALDRKQSLDDLMGAFDGLNRTHHRVLVMRELEGLSYHEIGERLGMSRPAVESTLFRARRRLGEEYQELVTGERCVRVQHIIATASAAVPGARDRRRLSAHLAHCQPCRRHAAAAGLEVGTIAPRGIRTKIAGAIPLPAFLWQRWSAETRAPGGARPAAALAQLSAHVAPVVEPASGGWVRAAAAAATLVVAGVAGEHVVSEHGRSTAAPRAGTMTQARGVAAAPSRTTAGATAPQTVSARMTASPHATAKRSPRSPVRSGFAVPGSPRRPSSAVAHTPAARIPVAAPAPATGTVQDTTAHAALPVQAPSATVPAVPAPIGAIATTLAPVSPATVDEAVAGPALTTAADAAAAAGAAVDATRSGSVLPHG